MEKKTKLIIGISLGLVAAAGAYILIAKPFKTKEKSLDDIADKTPEDKTKEVEQKHEPSQKLAVTLKKALSTKPVNHSNTAVTSAPKPTAKPVIQTGPPEMGTKVFAHVPMNIYTEPNASRTKVYKFLKRGSYIGTFLATEKDFSKVIIEVKNKGMAALVKPFENKVFFVKTKEIGV
jgi:hypothetical protein